jgi:SpoVK/Ycf46/Vps4 family AAA+-type ATPase
MQMKTTLTDKRVAGYVNHNDRPDTVYALKNHYVLGPKSDEDRQMKQQISNLLKSIDTPEQQQNIPPMIPDVPKELPGTSKVHTNLDKDIVRSIEESILDHSPNVTWNDIKGLEEVKKILNETIVLPTLRPEIFKGLLSPSKGILLYGPPGNGKTMLAKAIATECKSTFFNCSASTLTSKWMGEGEKLMKCLFALAYEKAPAVIFIDEIDSIMGARGG